MRSDEMRCDAMRWEGARDDEKHDEDVPQDPKALVRVQHGHPHVEHTHHPPRATRHHLTRALIPPPPPRHARVPGRALPLPAAAATTSHCVNDVLRGASVLVLLVELLANLLQCGDDVDLALCGGALQHARGVAQRASEPIVATCHELGRDGVQRRQWEECCGECVHCV
jgi:hypothetical protein